MIITKQRIRTVMFGLFSLTALWILLVYPAPTAAGITRGLLYTGEILIPSLFPYMVLSSFVMRSPLIDHSGRFAAIMMKAFGLPGCCLIPMVFSFIGGYPIGAKCAAMLYEEQKLTSGQVQRFLSFCVCPGPAFLVTAIGSILLNHPFIGWLLYLSQLLSCLMMGVCGHVLSKLAQRQSRKPVPSKMAQDKIGSHAAFDLKKSISPVNAFIAASYDGASTMLGMAALVAVFALLGEAVQVTGFAELITGFLGCFGIGKARGQVIVPILLEVTGAVHSVSELSLPLWYYSLAAGFGGLCVHFQIFAILNKVPLRKGRYLFCRVINGILSFGITFWLSRYFSMTEDVFAVSGNKQAMLTSSTVSGSIALVVMCMIFVLTMQKEQAPRHKILSGKI